MKDTVEKYIRLREKANHRYRSWGHCFRAFNNTNDIDYLSLHLAFYPASWGMLRGSSLLLQKDYKIHIPIVKIILSKEGQSLKKTGIDQSDINSIANLFRMLFPLTISLRSLTSTLPSNFPWMVS